MHGSPNSGRSNIGSPNNENPQEIKESIQRRLLLIFDHCTVFLYIIVVYGGGLISSFLIIKLISSLLSEEIDHSIVVKIFLEYIKLGIAVCVATLGVFEGVLTSFDLIKDRIVLSFRKN